MSELTHKEKIEALLEGKVLAHASKMNYRKLNEKGMLTFTNKQGTEDNSSPCTCLDLETLEPVKPWYEEIPEEGVVCFVWDDNTALKSIATIISYEAGCSLPYTDALESIYQNAVPLIAEELTLYNQLMFSAHAL